MPDGVDGLVQPQTRSVAPKCLNEDPATGTIFELPADRRALLKDSVQTPAVGHAFQLVLAGVLEGEA